MNVINIRFFGLSGNISSWVNEGQWYKTDQLNSVAASICGNNGPMFIPLSDVSRVEIRQLDCDQHAFNLSKGGYCVNCGLSIEEYKKNSVVNSQSNWDEYR